MSETERFDPRKHLMDLKGKKYLPVAPRIVAFREECPIKDGWSIRTERLEGGRADGYALYKATIIDPTGRIVAEGTKLEDKAGFADFEEKAETGSVGRALAAAGYGTLYAIEWDEGADVCDAPQAKPARPAAATAPKPAAPKPAAPKPAAPESAASVVCTLCNDVTKPVPPGRLAFLKTKNLPASHFECEAAQAKG